MINGRITEKTETDSLGYFEQCHEFTEKVRHMLGAGYGIGYQLDDLWRVLEARNDAFVEFQRKELKGE